jgi:sulfatase-like protein
VVPLTAWAVLLGALIVKIFWIVRITPQPARYRRQAAESCLAIAMMLVCGLQFTSFRLAGLRAERSNRAVYVYGYINAWIAQFLLSPNVKEGLARLRELQSISPDRLSATEKTWPVGSKVAVLQLESVCWNVLGYKINGQEVAPYLTALAQTSRLFKIQAYHNLNSADMDYAVLSGGTPSPTMVSYELPNVAYPNALPHFMQQHGFHTVSFHGNSGAFFNRRGNFTRMGFDEIWFKEEFAGRPVRSSSWGIRDEELFNLSSKKMREAQGPEFHFIITLDTHAPFNLISESEKEIFPHCRVLGENYLNSIRVLDEKLRDYVESLPTGTMVILYGDHTSGVEYDGFHSAREGPAEFVPCIVHVCQPKEAWPVKPDPPIQLSENLRIHDVINVVRHQLAH